MFKYLLSLGLDKNSVDKIGKNVLLFACIGGNVHMFDYLVSLGFDRNFTDRIGSNALHYSSIEVVKHLLNLGYDINYEDKQGKNALSYLLRRYDNNKSTYLLQRGITIKQDDADRLNLKECQQRVKSAKFRLLIFRTLINFMMGFIRHRYWLPDGNGYHYAQQQFRNRCEIGVKFP